MNRPFEHMQRHHFMDKSLIIYMGRVLNTENGILLTILINTNIRLSI